MRPVLNRAQIRAFDQEWMARGVAGILLMENAGRGAAHLIGLKARPRPSGEAPRTSSAVVGTCIRCADERSLGGLSVLILAGPGNNGGDGFVVARHLASRSALVRVVLIAEEAAIQGDARLAFAAMQAVGVSAEPLPDESEWGELFAQADVVVDALLGTGANREVQGTFARVIEALNESRAHVISLDVPSGLDADTGARLGPVVSASHTVTFAHLKTGLLTTEGHRASGTITVSHIGVPSALSDSEEPAAWLLEESDIRARLVQRSPTLHKGSAGRVVVVAGSPGTVGAARLCASTSLRAGAGLTTIFTSPETAGQLQEDIQELMTHGWSFSGEGSEEADASLMASAQALVVGPGLGRTRQAEQALELALASGKPTVLDADALRLLAGRHVPQGRPLLGGAAASLVVLTPHPGEAADLLGSSIADIEKDRFGAARRLAERTGTTVILKGSRTVIAAPGFTPVVSAFGSPVLATAGSGDVLAGICGALLAFASDQKEIFERAQTAVSLHGLCGETWEQRHGDRGMLASDLAGLLPDVFGALLSTG